MSPENLEREAGTFMDHTTHWQRCQETKAYLEKQLSGFKPEVAIVLGSGLGNLSKKINVHKTIPYAEIPHFKPTSVVGHLGNLIFGTLGERSVVCQQGRYHYYEGHSVQETVFPVRVMHALGASTLLVTNAAGGIDASYRVGDIMLIRDHINFQGANCLTGQNEEAFGPRFPDMTYAYCPEYAAKTLEVAKGLGFTLREGVYLSVSGPCYETPAEIRMFRLWGANAVGMSTVNEVIAAVHCGMRVLGFSCISNAAAGMQEEKLDHSDVEKAIHQIDAKFEALIVRVVREL